MKSRYGIDSRHQFVRCPKCQSLAPITLEKCQCGVLLSKAKGVTVADPDPLRLGLQLSEAKKKRQRERQWDKIGTIVYRVVIGMLCILALIVCCLPILLDDGTPSRSSTSTSTPNVSNGEFDYAYDQFRSNGMSEQEAGAAARATTNFLDKQRAARAAEADRQRN